MADDQVERLNASIRWRMGEYERTASRSVASARREHMRFQDVWLREHQPEGGVWGAPCLGEHRGDGEAVQWPCDGVLKLDSPLAYLD